MSPETIQLPGQVAEISKGVREEVTSLQKESHDRVVSWKLSEESVSRETEQSMVSNTTDGLSKWRMDNNH